MQEYYYKLVIRVSAYHSLFSDFLADVVEDGFEESDDGFIIRSEDELDELLWGLEYFKDELSKTFNEEIDLECEITKEKNSDWVEVFKNSITSLEIDRFFVHPYWSEPSDKLINITINPALAFGTGHHPTTASALSAVCRYVSSGSKVLDVGCGSGILGIGASKLGAVVDACDTDELCIGNSRQNLELNGVNFNNLWVGSCSEASGSYNVVIANIVADVLTFIAPDLKRVLRDDGVLILSGILDKYESKVLKFYSEFNIKEKIVKEEWVTLVLSRI